MKENTDPILLEATKGITEAVENILNPDRDNKKWAWVCVVVEAAAADDFRGTVCSNLEMDSIKRLLLNSAVVLTNTPDKDLPKTYHKVPRVQ